MSLRDIRLPGRHTLRIGNALLGGLLVWVMLGSSPTTAAYLSVALADASNVVATAKQFTISDVTAVAKPAGSILVSWSAASWAAGGYSVRRSTSPTGPFAEVVVVGAGVSSYSDTSGVDGTTYSYKVFGLSGAGGTGTGSNVASAKADATNPTVSSTLPSAGATSVVLNTSATITFSEAMNTALAGASMALVDCGASATCVSGTTSVSGAANWPTTSSVVFVPTAPLTASHWYGIQLTTAATDLTGNALSCAGASAQAGPTCYWTFQTGSSAGAPGLAASAPRAGATGVPTNTSLSFVWTAALSGTGQSDAAAGFSLQQASGAGSPCYVYSGSGQVPLCVPHGGTWSNPFADGSLLILASPLLASTTYTAVESANDASNLVVSSSATWTTAAGADSTPPSVTRVVPDDGTSGISPSTTVTVTFSEPMDVAVTAHAFALKPWSVAASCSGVLGGVSAGTTTWNSAAELIFHPAADLTAGACYHVAVGAGAADVSENSLGNGYGGSNFTVFGSAAPSVTLGNGAYYYPGATITAAGSGWGTGSGNVVPKWDDGTSLDAGGTPVVAGSFSGYAFSLPSTASSGSHVISFVRAAGATIGVPLTVQSPSSISLSASSTDISAGGSATITATVYDQGQPAGNAAVAFAITTDPGTRGSFIRPGSSVSTSGLTNGSGQPAIVTLFVSSGVSFTPITVTATSGSASKTITIIDPAPLPPQDVRLTASDRLEIAWLASPSSTVTQYQVSLGTASGRYDHVILTGARTSDTEMDVIPGQTYYAVVRASDAHGALSDASPEVHISMPALVATRLTLVGANPPIGGETTSLTASVTDQYGRPLVGAQVTFSAPTGIKLEAPKAAAGGAGALAGGAVASGGGAGASGGGAGASGGGTAAASGGGASSTIEVTRVDPLLRSATVRATSGSATDHLEVVFTPWPATPTATSSPTTTPAATVTPSAVPTASPVPPTATLAPTGMPSATAAPTHESTLGVLAGLNGTPTSGGTPTPGSTPLPGGTPTPEGTATPTVGPLASPSTTPSPGTSTATPTLGASATSTPTSTPGTSTPTATPATPTPTATTEHPTATATAEPPTATATAASPTSTAAPVATSTAVPPTSTATAPPTSTPASTSTPLPTSTRTPVPASPTPAH